jgi:hypothetical protein
VSDSLTTRLDVPYGQQPETRAAAMRYVSRQEDAELLLQALGLTDDPLALERARAKALADMHGKHKKRGAQ